MIVHVTPEFLDPIWPNARPFIEKATKRTNGRYEPDDVYQEIKDGHQTLWVVWDKERNALDAAITTQFVDYPRMTALRVLFVGGRRMRSWLSELWLLLQDFARKHGAKGIEGGGREEWAAACPGMRVEGVFLFKDL